MKASWKTLVPIWLGSVVHQVSASTPLQYCTLKVGIKTDLCFAVASWKNSTTQANDLSLQISARFVVDATGWAAVGIGEKMHKALMFVMYPGGEGGRITVSIRSTSSHSAPKVAEGPPETHVTRTWIEEDGLHNAQIMCYGCESWTGTELDVSSTSQSWIWAMNWKQQTHSDDVHLKLMPHTDRGMAELNMASSFFASDEVEAQVSTQRISQQPGGPDDAAPAPVSTGNSVMDDTKDDHPAKEHHKHSFFGLVSLHGFLLASGFFALTFGVLGIRSGAAKSYDIHWVVQTSAGSAIVLGCLMGIWISFKHGGHFSTYHQWIGLSILPSIIIQGLLGYLHHVNYLKYGRRTTVSYYHIWIGRGALLIGNLNVGFGLSLGHADSFKWFIWYAGLIIQLSVLIPMWYFWRKGQTMLDAARGKEAGRDGVEYASVEQDAFIVDDELDELDDEGHDEGAKHS